MTQDDVYILKCVSAGMPIPTLAKRLRLTEEEVKERFEKILKEVHSQDQSGYNQLCERYRLLCQQYELVGNSLGTISSAIGSLMTEDELRAIVTDNKEETIKNLRTLAIVLRRWSAPSPEEEMKHMENLRDVVTKATNSIT